MKTSEIQRYTGGTDTCMKILVMANKVCVQLTPNETSSDIFTPIHLVQVKFQEGPSIYFYLGVWKY